MLSQNLHFFKELLGHENCIKVKPNHKVLKVDVHLPNDTFVMVSARALISSNVESCKEDASS